MKNKTLTILSSLAILFITYGFYCTNFPLSDSTIIKDTRILGYWQENDTTVHHFFQDSLDIPYLGQFTLIRGKWEYKLTYDIYFTSIRNKNIENHFFEVEDLGGYQAYKYFFLSNDTLKVVNFSDEFVSRYKKMIDDEIKFDSSFEYYQFVKRFMDDPNFYGDTTTLTKIISPRE